MSISLQNNQFTDSVPWDIIDGVLATATNPLETIDSLIQSVRELSEEAELAAADSRTVLAQSIYNCSLTELADATATLAAHTSALSTSATVPPAAARLADLQHTIGTCQTLCSLSGTAAQARSRVRQLSALPPLQVLECVASEPSFGAMVAGLKAYKTEATLINENVQRAVNAVNDTNTSLEDVKNIVKMLPRLPSAPTSAPAPITIAAQAVFVRAQPPLEPSKWPQVIAKARETASFISGEQSEAVMVGYEQLIEGKFTESMKSLFVVPEDVSSVQLLRNTLNEIQSIHNSLGNLPSTLSSIAATAATATAVAAAHAHCRAAHADCLSALYPRTPADAPMAASAEATCALIGRARAIESLLEATAPGAGTTLVNDALQAADAALGAGTCPRWLTGVLPAAPPSCREIEPLLQLYNARLAPAALAALAPRGALALCADVVPEILALRTASDRGALATATARVQNWLSAQPPGVPDSWWAVVRREVRLQMMAEAAGRGEEETAIVKQIIGD